MNDKKMSPEEAQVHVAVGATLTLVGAACMIVGGYAIGGLEGVGWALVVMGAPCGIWGMQLLLK